MQESLAGSEGLSYICNHYMGLHWSTSRQCCFLNHPLFNDVTPLVDMSAATLAVGGNNDERLTDVDKVVPTLVSFSSLLPPEFILCSTVSLYSAPSSLCSYLTPLQPQDHAHIVTLFYSHYIILLTAVVGFLSVIDKTKIQSPHCTSICLAPHLAIIYTIYDLTDDTPLYSPASSRLQTLLLCHIEISNVSSTYRRHPTTHLYLFIQSGGLVPPTVSHTTRVGKNPCRG